MHPFRVLPLLVVALACTSEDSKTPECADVEACNPPPICAEAPEDPVQCCKDAEGNPFEGSDLALCMIAFGEDPPAGVGGNGATGGTSAGGGGAAPGGAGGAGGDGGS